MTDRVKLSGGAIAALIYALVGIEMDHAFTRRITSVCPEAVAPMAMTLVNIALWPVIATFDRVSPIKSCSGLGKKYLPRTALKEQSNG